MRVLGVAGLILLAACASTGGLPREPFDDVPVPAGWIAYSRDWVMIRSPEATVAKLVYFAETSPEATLAAGRALLVARGWSEEASERFVNPERFAGVWMQFTKGRDLCRVTVIEGAQATHVDYTVARRD